MGENVKVQVPVPGSKHHHCSHKPFILIWNTTATKWANSNIGVRACRGFCDSQNGPIVPKIQATLEKAKSVWKSG